MIFLLKWVLVAAAVARTLRAACAIILAGALGQRMKPSLCSDRFH
jgi:hypothetical protein